MILVGDQRAVHVSRHIPAECLVDLVVLGRGGKILIAPDHMGDPHQVVVDHVGEIIGGITVGLDQDQVLQLFVGDGNIPVNVVMEGGGPFCGHIKPYHIRLPGCQVGLHLFFAKTKTVLVIHHNLSPVVRHLGLQGIQPLLVAEAVVGIPLLDQLFGILKIQT